MTVLQFLGGGGESRREEGPLWWIVAMDPSLPPSLSLEIDTQFSGNGEENGNEITAP